MGNNSRVSSRVVIISDASWEHRPHSSAGGMKWGQGEPRGNGGKQGRRQVARHAGVAGQSGEGRDGTERKIWNDQEEVTQG